MRIAFYINQTALTDLISQTNFNYEAFCYSLLEGDCKNDKQPRKVKIIRPVAADQYGRLIEIIEEDVCLLMSKAERFGQIGHEEINVIYLVGFTNIHAEALRELKLRHSLKLVAVNEPRQRHPAAIVAIADHLKRIRGHHLFWAVNNRDYAPNVDIVFPE